MWVWAGVGSNQGEKEVGLKVAEEQFKEMPVKEVKEGEEPDEFW